MKIDEKDLITLSDDMNAEEYLKFLESLIGEAPKGICICSTEDGGCGIIGKTEHFHWMDKLTNIFFYSEGFKCSKDYIKKR